MEVNGSPNGSMGRVPLRAFIYNYSTLQIRYSYIRKLDVNGTSTNIVILISRGKNSIKVNKH